MVEPWTRAEVFAAHDAILAAVPDAHADILDYGYTLIVYRPATLVPGKLAKLIVFMPTRHDIGDKGPTIRVPTDEAIRLLLAA